MYEKASNFRLFIVVYAGDYGIQLKEVKRGVTIHFLQLFSYAGVISFGLVVNFVYAAAPNTNMSRTRKGYFLE